MTDRLKGFTVILQDPMRADDAEDIVKALTMVKGVLKVVPHVQTGDEYFAEVRARLKFRERLLEFIEAELKK